MKTHFKLIIAAALVAMMFTVIGGCGEKDATSSVDVTVDVPCAPSIDDTPVVADQPTVVTIYFAGSGGTLDSTYVGYKRLIQQLYKDDKSKRITIDEETEYFPDGYSTHYKFFSAGIDSDDLGGGMDPFDGNRNYYTLT